MAHLGQGLKSYKIGKKPTPQLDGIQWDQSSTSSGHMGESVRCLSTLNNKLVGSNTPPLTIKIIMYRNIASVLVYLTIYMLCTKRPIK